MKCVAAVVLGLVLMTGCGSSADDATGTTSSATTVATPGCTRDTSRDPFCFSPAGGGFPAEAFHAYTCPTDGTPIGVTYARSADGCGDPTPTASKFVAVICCP